MAASDAAEVGAANPGLTAAASGAHGQAEAILRMANAQMAGRERWPAASGDAGEVEAMEVQTRQAAASGDAREIVAPLPTAPAAENGEPGETEAIKEADNREGMMAAAGRVEIGRAHV